MKRDSLLTSVMLAVIGMSGLLTACSKSNNSTSGPTPNPAIQLKVDAKFGNILTDSSGKTLYFFADDANGASACTGGCLAAWPAFYKSSLTLSTGLNSSDFATITRPDGTKQTTFKGWPLYYYAPDLAAGDIKGDLVGNVWFVAKPDYSIMLANAQLVGADNVQYTSNYTAGTGLTPFITDSLGRTLYVFSPDKFKKNTFTKADLSNNAVWPVAEIGPVKNLPSIFTKTDFDTIHVFGKVQLTFKGWPLYYFGADNLQRGSTKGVSVPHPGVWPIANNASVVAPQ